VGEHHLDRIVSVALSIPEPGDRGKHELFLGGSGKRLITWGPRDKK
jgi:hypothetical protein